jgi:hypothetical protein
MKKITTLFFACLFAISMGAQQASLIELLERLDQNHMGSITEVFTHDEIIRLRTHFDGQSEVESLRYSGNMLIRSTENTNGDMVIIDPADPSTIDIIGPSPLNEFEGAGAIMETSTTAIIVDNMNNFYEVQADGNFTTIGEIPALNGQSFTGLEFADDGTLYGIATDGAGSTALYEIDLVGGQAIPIGGDNGLVVGIALGRDMNNNLYTYDIDTNRVYRINRITGAPTLLGDIGFDPNFGQGMGFDILTGLLFITAFNNDTFKPELRTVNTTTGASTLVGTIAPSQTLQFAWMSFFDSTLGVDDTSFQNISIVPNPAKDVLQVFGNSTIENLKVHSLLGQLLIEQQPNIRAFDLNVSSLKSGTYFISFEASGERATFKFIKH